MKLGAVHFKQWLEAQDRLLLILVALTVVGLIPRFFLAVGFMLGDDIPYTDLVRDFLLGNYMQIGPIGQYAYRPMWLYPVALGIKWFGWSPQAFVLYPLLTGSLIPLLTALWLRRHLPRGSLAPVLCAVILLTYPTLFVDSLMLVNEIPMIFWCLVCVLLFGPAFGHLAQSPRLTSRPWRLGAWSFLSGAAFCAAYQVKTAAIPVLGLWLAAEFLLQVRQHGWPKLAPLQLAAVCFVLPVIAVQAFYFVKIGHPLGNFKGELKLYDLWVPPEYFEGKYNSAGILSEYPRQLLFLDGYPGFRILLHGIWVWMGLALALVGGLFWKKLPAEHRAMALALFVVTAGLYLFMEYWPARTKPYYIPNCFTGRPWRYMDVIAPTVAAWIAILLTLPGLYDRRFFQGLRIVLLAGGFGVAGYGLMVRCYEFADRASEFRRVAADKAILEPYLDVPHYTDVNGFGALRSFMGVPKRPLLVGRGSGSTGDRFVVDFRRFSGGCVWTGGARRYGVNVDDAWTPNQVQAIGGTLRLVHTWDSDLRPWRKNSLQLWAFEPNPPQPR